MSRNESALCTVEDALDELRAGRMIILVDDEDRENEGDLVIAAEKITPQAVNFMITHGRGLVCLVMTPERIEFLGLQPVTKDNRSKFGTAFHTPIEAANGVTTGISAFDRAHTIRTAVDPASKPEDIVTPGHIHTLRARSGGALVRAGQTEGSLDLARMAGLNPSAVICEVMKDDGSMARMPDLEVFAKTHGIKICSVERIIEYRRRHEKLVTRVAETTMPTEFGPFRLYAYETTVDDYHHVALVLGDITPADEVLVRVHSECLTGDVFGSLRCDCGKQLDEALRMIAAEGRGVLLYMRQEGRGIGLVNKIRAYELQDKGLDTVEANLHLGFRPDPRDYGIGAQILNDIGVHRMRLITNNPSKRVGLEAHGLEVTGRVPLIIKPNEVNERYLKTKMEKLGHLLG
ncbi:MAG: bifunctional 3,4-dihydroxy-2-butanone-4-phosphate synthase/GTP cyclohydrolase II [Candidatus Hydrogenedentes bacterium]|nr:bifunctional 3,4-dihydroxy-2-butanone-4-phosphate synthase/GTP cyclohydrolase II [Candidatus Hydrogenedentota bacterium]